ncbi:metal-dependent hydrolase family protein [Pseudomonas citronellolis]|uniref:metal-dependent hydrolase family protein n=1 Tax=Pseudomonas citronellolis TaxID=53408 RepID=UPI0023E3F0F3|nr:amidohydrolase family protein [Pseudomonas citronellolis]MDF3936364.1 amidohydrolase family protein [Pseudomonas citronellolis]
MRPHSYLASMRGCAVSLGLLLASSVATAAPEATAPAEASVLIRNVRVFDGKATSLSAPTDVLIRGNRIARIASGAQVAEGEAPAQTLDGGGRTLMPGLIDNHAHLTFWTLPLPVMMTADPVYLQIREAAAARDFLMAGFTSARDVSGPAFGLKRAIDEGLVPGPRIWPSGPMVSQTSGHSDFRQLSDLPGSANPTPIASVRLGYTAVADGVAEVHKVVRENLMRGASQIKLAVGGGVSSNYDPVDVTEYTREEIAAAVADADNWGTYVTVHAYTPKAIRMAVEAGVKCIEHGQLIDEPTLKLLAERKVWLSLQPFLEDEDAIPTVPGSDNERKYRQVAEGTARAYQQARKLGVRVAFGTDIQMNAKGAERLPFYLPKLTTWFSPAEVLKQATADNAELLALSGPRNPYPGKLGVVQEGALADLLLVDGDPLTDIKLLQDPARNLRVIMKDGKVYKNTLP